MGLCHPKTVDTAAMASKRLADLTSFFSLEKAHHRSSFHHSPDCSGLVRDVHGASMCVEARATLVSDVKLDDALCLRPDAFNVQL